MANTNVSHGEVKSIVSGLECSPSMHDSKGNYGGKPSIKPTAKNGEATVSSEKTGEFNMTDRGRALPNYKNKFAKGATQE